MDTTQLKSIMPNARQKTRLSLRVRTDYITRPSIYGFNAGYGMKKKIPGFTCREPNPASESEILSERTLMTTPLLETPRLLSTAEGFLLGGIAACVAVCRLISPLDLSHTNYLGYFFKSCGGSKDKVTTTG